jgi:hypothetical protein
MQADIEEKLNGLGRNIEKETYFFEKTFEHATIIDHNNTAKNNLERNILNKETNKINGSDIVSGQDENKPGQIAYDFEQIGGFNCCSWQ